MTLQSVWELIKKTASSWNDINAPRLGAALAYYSILSMAPLLVVCIAIAGLVFGQKAAQDQIAYQVQSLVGAQGGEALQTLLAHAGQPSQGFTAAVVGFAVLLFGASGVFGELRDSLNLVWNAPTTSSGGLVGLIKYRFFSFAMVLGVGFLLLVSLVLSAAIGAAGKFFAQYLPAPEVLLHAANLVFSFLVVTALFALLYKVVPDVKIEWRDVWIGAAVTSLLFSIGKFLIGLYLGKASVGSAYGAAGSIVVFIVWLYYSAQIFFLGAEFTHVFAERHGSRAHGHTEGVEAPREDKAPTFRPKLA
ncbi:MAG: ribonuclease BN [Proteobacteria bacterium]|nr:MAG: ribonuclease BN [Pseudomonadota bacterium]